MVQKRAGQRTGWTSSTRPGSAWKPFNDVRILERVRLTIAAAREIVPRYGTGRPSSSSEIDRLVRACSMEVVRANISVPADVWPPLNGVSYLFVAEHVGPAELRYIKLHEIGHRLAGDIEEPTMFVFDGPLPESEEVADLFALLGILDTTELEQGPEFIETRIRELVPLENYGWQTYRVPRLAGKVINVAALCGDEKP